MGMQRQSKDVSRSLIGIALLVSGVLVAGCSASVPDAPAQTPGPSRGSEIPVPTSTFEPGPSASYRGLTIQGALVREGQCLRLIADKGALIPGTLDILWPRGTTAYVMPSGEVEVVAQGGIPLAVTGTRVYVTGGTGKAESPSGCLSPDRSQIQLETVQPAS